MDFRDNIDLSRVERYGSNEQSPELFQSQNLNDLKPYYNGELVNSRMAEVRKSITYIRNHWDDRAKFARGLAEFLAGRLNSEVEKDFMKRVDLIKNEDLNWGDIDETQLEKSNFNVIRLYTSETGYNKIFGIMNSLFRYDDTTNDPKTIQTIVFLVELLNIDLYNLCLKNKSCDNFTGIVYRGVGLKDEDFDAFKSLMKKEIQQRYIAIPLCLMSSTTNIEMAKRFICSKPNAILFKIHILEMKPRFLQHYKERNPTGVVSTICAVDIKSLSDFPEEEEIILRGAFFQVLDFYQDHKENMHVLEVCMLNSNRDHLSSNFLTDPNARKMFGLMVSVTRNEFAVQFYKERGNEEEALAYKECLEQAKKNLALLIPEHLV
eukprot:gene10482-19193_t